ncbi:MAG: DUF1254 domain-containing protein [Bacteroidota bacterium]
MKKKWLEIGGLVGGIILGFFGMLYGYPSLVFKVVEAAVSPGDNICYAAKLPSAESKVVVKPNPDFLYVTCHYNLDQGPLRLTGHLPDTSYWSLALYKPNTVNTAIINDRDLPQSNLELILMEEGMPIPPKLPEGAMLLPSPSKTGLLLFRILVSDPSSKNLQTLGAYQQSLQITHLQ